MSRYSYLESRLLNVQNVPFYALIMAAMRKADPVNLSKLQTAWPNIWVELLERFNTAGGYTTQELENMNADERARVIEQDVRDLNAGDLL